MNTSRFHNSTLMLLPDIELSRADSPAPAGLWRCSLPVPPGASGELSLCGHPTYVKPLGQWPGASAASPRRLLLTADGGNQAPEMLSLDAMTHADTPTPAAEMVSVARSDDQRYIWEQHALRINWQGRELQLMLGLRTGGELRWWEACGLEEEESTPFCRVVHMAGSIPRQWTSAETFRANAKALNHPLLHVHNWLSGHLYVRLYANGVVEVYARHINSRYVDDGLDLEDVVPIIGVRCPKPGNLLGAWDGSRAEFELDGIAWDVSETARLASTERPGRVTWADGWLALQPYAGVEVYSGACANSRSGDPWIWKADQRMFPRGMARTLRFSLSFGDRSPRIARYLPPYWWYGLTSEIQHTPYLPVANDFDRISEHLRTWLHTHIVQGGFEDGAIPRGAPLPVPPDAPSRYEAGWEGDAPYGMFMLAYRTGDGTDFHNALRNTYHFTDVAVDHAARLVRMHGFPPVAFAQPMHRVIGTIMGYLETGDPYLLDTAESVVENAFRCHRNSWPRMAVGRDACFIRGAVMLYRYFNNPHFRNMAREAALNVAHSQRANGSFGDQGGGAGIHAWGGYITKPWMAMLATMPLLDYLELFPDEPELVQCIQRTGDWLMDARFKHDDGSVGWSYQHDYDGGPDFFNFADDRWAKLPGTEALWHMDNLGRLLATCSMMTGNGAYLDAWAQSVEGIAHQGQDGGDHSVAASMLSLPRLQSWIWKPCWTANGITIDPFHYGDRTPRKGIILAPNGNHTVRWADDGRVETPPGVVARQDAR